MAWGWTFGDWTGGSSKSGGGDHVAEKGREGGVTGQREAMKEGPQARERPGGRGHGAEGGREGGATGQRGAITDI